MSVFKNGGGTHYAESYFTMENTHSNTDPDQRHVWAGGISSTYNFNIWIDAGNWGSIINDALSAWNGISPNVQVTNVGGSFVGGARVLTYSPSQDGLDTSTLAITRFFNNQGTEIAATSLATGTIAAYMRIDLYNASFPVDTSGYGYNSRFRTTVHELGHALSLGHTNTYNPYTVMTQTRYDETYLRPNYIDRIHLRIRRGF